MTNPRLRSLNDAANSFRELGAAIEVHGDVFGFSTLWGDDYKAWVKWDSANALVLISQTLPVVPEERRADAALEIQRIHLGLSVLGFVLNPETGALDFRTHLPLGPDGSVRRDLLQRTFKFVVQVCEKQAVRLTLGPGLAEPWWSKA